MNITFNIYEIMIHPKTTFFYPCFQVDMFKERIKEFQVKGIHDKFLEYDLVDSESNIGRDDIAHS